MDIATSTLFCLHKPLEHALLDIVDSDTSLIELVDAGQHTLTEERIERLMELKEEHFLSYSIHAPYTDVNLAADDPSIRSVILERITASIRWASMLEARVLVFHPGNSTAIERYTPGLAWRINLESVDHILSCADRYGVKAMIENVPEPFPYVMKSVDDFERFYDETERDAEMVLDVAHANIRGETLSFIGRFSDAIGHVHVSDNNGDSDVHLQLGKGSIDWAETISALKGVGYDGWITVESYEGIGESIQLLNDLI
ncbi:MAG: sugar phosphate isomerase/epimerase [Candidatus Bathyarchaeota archaeon]|nr:MAG: sugar phosphate isomerase/epimerase [Candidatus Bathyarchaeota archaeon]